MKSRPFRPKRQPLQKSKSEQQNRSMPSIVRGPISWCRPQLVQERPLSWCKGFWIRSSEAFRFRSSLSRPLRSRQQASSRNVWKVNLEKPCKRVMTQNSSNTWPVKSQMSQRAISEPWTPLPKRY